ncbi:PIN domain-containing protein [Hoeflea sp. EC-HK425]|uniref:PIN domain-containing protein n=1 Tax=Hoeflea sp. EC-HK425 TaxID=2038388 RepID=UPI0012526353|nr:PIN domain-containing protein [Hoeflea sp. EC-HK425]VVT35255.1 putative nucleic acid-binding protein [Hoeflea sp. EC-HK425]
MTCSSSLSDVKEALVLDTSVLINLHACGYGEQILAAIPNDIIVTQIVAGELEHETSRRNGEHSFLKTLVASQGVSVTELTDSEFEIFFELTSSAPELDDGEAATLAVAAARGCLPIIDEKRGRGRATTLLPGRKPGWSLELFRHPVTLDTLGDEGAREALFLALRDGRMRIPAISTDEVIALIGEERARDCTCLPGYKLRFGARIEAGIRAGVA